MMRTTILFVLLFSTLYVSAQRPLEYKDVSKADENYPTGKNAIARVTLSVKENLQPTFKCWDQLVNPVEIETVADKVYYHLHFSVAQPNARITLEVTVNGISPCNIPLTLNINRWYRYDIFDPDATIVDCYNQLMREGTNLFTNALYDEAREKYEAVKNCSKIENLDKVNAQIILIDSIQQWRDMADASFAVADYPGCIAACQRILAKNPKDEYNRNRLTESRLQQREDCAAMFRIAQSYFENKDYKNAQPLYEKVIDRSCTEATQAFARLEMIRNTKQLPHVLTYEYEKDVPVGFSTGNYKQNKTSGYFTLRFNPDVFEMARTGDKEQLTPELNLSFGWTIKIVKPVWIFFGPGYTGKGRYVPEESTGEEEGEEEFSLQIKHAVSPEVGLVAKFNLSAKVGLALRYTFQYRYALEKASEEYMGPIRHILGIGFCF
ncbi:MAG: tetratricopeptide repeat protein [Dysgonamonadaceae bacterium]|jgi:tetratricopeptide (TPR) repeat protein|nr:tetratricopeptide repeat protein [Dysgonamonadaceae bacterium]